MIDNKKVGYYIPNNSKNLINLLIEKRKQLKLRMWKIENNKD